MELGKKIELTVSILTCNRKDVLLELLEDLRRQTLYGQFEIIVVDNHSLDGTPEAVAQRFPEVRYIRLAANTGCAGRNAGMKEASGEIVVTLDDDVFFRRADEAERILSVFSSNKDADVINFKILFHDNQALIPFNWFHPRKHEEYSESTFETDYISEGAVAFRKKIFHKVGYYPEDFFISHEGYDLAYRIIDNDFKIIYSHEIEVLHKISREQRTSWRNTYYDTRNYIWLLVKYLPFKSLIRQLSYRILTTFLFSLRRGQPHWYGKALFDALQGLPLQFKKRKVLSKRTIMRLEEIRRFAPRLSYKIKNFLVKTSGMNERV